MLNLQTSTFGICCFADCARWGKAVRTMRALSSKFGKAPTQNCLRPLLLPNLVSCRDHEHTSTAVLCHKKEMINLYVAGPVSGR